MNRRTEAKTFLGLLFFAAYRERRGDQCVAGEDLPPKFEYLK